MNVRILLTAVALLVCTGCLATASTMKIPAEASRIPETFAPMDGHEDLGKITVKHGNGCGVYGARGTREGAIAKLKAQAYNRRAKAVQLLDEKEPGMEKNGVCFDNEYVITARLYGAAFREGAESVALSTRICENRVSPDGYEWADEGTCTRYTEYKKTYPDLAKSLLATREKTLQAHKEEQADLALQQSREVDVTLSSKDALTKQGACTNGYTNPVVGVEVCFSEGRPNSLDDDGKARLNVALTSDGIELAKPEDYRITVMHKGEQVYQEFGRDRVPSVIGKEFVGFHVALMPFDDWAPGAYTVDVVWRHDVDSKVRFNVTYE